LVMTQELLKHLSKKPATLRYPFEKRELFKDMRGRPVWNMKLCVGCGLCGKSAQPKPLNMAYAPRSVPKRPLRWLVRERMRDIRKMGGLMDKMPITSVACIIGAFSLIGIPPLNGFWSEWMIFGGGLASGKVLITLLGVASTMITAGYYLWFIWRVFFGAVPEGLIKVEDPPRQSLIPVVILTMACLVLGLLPDLMLTFIRPAAESLSGFIGG
jgi:hypothetical protein